MTNNLKVVDSNHLDTNECAMNLENLTISYSGKPAVKEVSFKILKNNVTAIIGPSGCGKSTLLRSLNRMNDFVDGVSVEGKISLNGMDLLDNIDPVMVRRQVGMVFQKPNPFPKSIYKNISWGPGINGYKGSMDELVEQSLTQAALWDEVKDRLHESALSLSGGQQQRLCIARALAMAPEILLMDEPCSALDPISTAHIEDLIFALKANYTIVIVTHNMQQAARISDYTAFMEMGNLIEFDVTNQIFTRPKEKRTEEYVTGRFG
ncbi:MAG: phosphate transport system ATP-binding protein [Candidatus Azotimanducaceae bacterium]|jgi:phosphate transport system ATP-binding protein